MKIPLVVTAGALVLALAVAAVRPAQATWPSNGLHVNDLGNPSAMLGDGSGGIFLHWGVATAQRISADGELLLGQNGPFLEDVDEVGPSFSDDAGGIYIAARQENTLALVHVGPLGQVLWSIPVCETSNGKRDLHACTDGVGGALVAWSESRALQPEWGPCAYCQRVDPNGNPMWTLNGLLIECESDAPPGPGPDQAVPVRVQDIAPAAPGGVAGGALVVTFVEGLRRWTGYRMFVHASGSGGGFPRVETTTSKAVSDGFGGAYLWSSSSSELYLERVSPTSPNWSVPVCIAAGFKHDAIVCADADGALMAWVDKRSGNDDIYLQRLDGATGTALWTENGIPACTASGAQTQVDVKSDFLEGAQLVWSDARNGDADIYTQHVDASGLTQQPDGVPVSSADGSEVSPKLYTDPAGYGIVSWTGFDGVFAQRITVTTVAVAISSFSARVRGEDVILNATLRSDLGVDFVRVYRAVGDGSLLLREANGSLARDRFQYVDDNALPATRYRYQLAVGDADGEFLSPIVTVTTPALEFSLEQNQPNPFNPETTIAFSLAKAARAVVDIYAVDGRLVRTLLDENRPAGFHQVTWDGTDAFGNAVGSGVYLYRLTSEKFSATNKMVLLK